MSEIFEFVFDKHDQTANIPLRNLPGWRRDDRKVRGLM
jgi:hypothetical protein